MREEMSFQDDMAPSVMPWSSSRTLPLLLTPQARGKDQALDKEDLVVLAWETTLLYSTLHRGASYGWLKSISTILLSDRHERGSAICCQALEKKRTQWPKISMSRLQPAMGRILVK